MTGARKLSDEDVQLIRALGEERLRLRARLAEITQSKVAEKFDVHVSTISAIQTYRYHYRMRGE